MANTLPGAMTDTVAHWDNRYATANTPWDSGLPSKELRTVLDERQVAPCRVLELGCGSGTNAVYLASRGFEVTAVDCSPRAIERGRERAAAIGVSVNWICHDVANYVVPGSPFDLIFDRGCYHCVRRTDVAGYLATIAAASQVGTRFLVLTGNANEKREPGPPALTEQEIRNDLEALFELRCIRPFYFEDAGEVQGPLGWSCWLERTR